MNLRLAMRIDDEWWVAFAAQPDTMDGAVELMRISLALVKQDNILKERVMEVAKEAFDAACREALGVTPEWPHAWTQAES